jgi:hypothetical protein
MHSMAAYHWSAASCPRGHDVSKYQQRFDGCTEVFGLCRVPDVGVMNVFDSAVLI